MKRVILVGSPRTGGRCSQLAEMLFEANIDERPEDELFLVPVSEVEVGPCIGCNACRAKMPVTFKADDGTEVTEERHRCVFDDDMQTVYDLLDDADALTVVCPVYFSGAPAPFKCVLDRLQPYFWAYSEDGPRLPKRPLDLHIVGEGGDPHGYDALVSEVRSASLLPGFAIGRIFDWVGKIAPDGIIQAEADVTELSNGQAGEPFAQGVGRAPATGTQKAHGANNERNASANKAAASPKPRPKLDLSGSKPATKQAKPQQGKAKQQAKPKQATGKGSGNRAKKGGTRG